MRASRRWWMSGAAVFVVASCQVFVGIEDTEDGTGVGGTSGTGGTSETGGTSGAGGTSGTGGGDAEVPDGAAGQGGDAGEDADAGTQRTCDWIGDRTRIKTLEGEAGDAARWDRMHAQQLSDGVVVLAQQADRKHAHMIRAREHKGLVDIEFPDVGFVGALARVEDATGEPATGFVSAEVVDGDGGAWTNLMLYEVGDDETDPVPGTVLQSWIGTGAPDGLAFDADEGAISFMYRLRDTATVSLQYGYYDRLLATPVVPVELEAGMIDDKADFQVTALFRAQDTTFGFRGSVEGALGVTLHVIADGEAETSSSYGLGQFGITLGAEVVSDSEGQLGFVDYVNFSTATELSLTVGKVGLSDLVTGSVSGLSQSDPFPLAELPIDANTTMHDGHMFLIGADPATAGALRFLWVASDGSMPVYQSIPVSDERVIGAVVGLDRHFGAAYSDFDVFWTIEVNTDAGLHEELWHETLRCSVGS